MIKRNFQQLKKELPNNKSVKDIITDTILNDFFPSSPTPNIKTKEVVHAIVDTTDLVAYADATGKFPYRSSRGNQYLLIAYHYDANHLWAEAMKNREKATIVEAYKKHEAYFEQAGVKPSIWILNNDFSNAFNNEFNDDINNDFNNDSNNNLNNDFI